MTNEDFAALADWEGGYYDLYQQGTKTPTDPVTRDLWHQLCDLYDKAYEIEIQLSRHLATEFV